MRERKIGRPVMNSNSEKAEGNTEIEYLTAEHGKIEQKRKRESNGQAREREKERDVFVSIT